MGLFVICNMEFLAKRSEMWKRIQESVEEVDALDGALTVKCEMHGKEQVITCGEDFDAKCREGGCDDPCNTRLNCGHMCPKPCHVEDMDHLVMKCLKPCAQTCPAEEKHPCKKRCYQACGDCKINVTKFLPCGHTKMDHCYLEAGEVLCVERCTETLQCFHRCDQLCGAPCTTKCQVIIKRQLPNCGHIVLMKCFDNPYTFKCHVIVPKQWTICGHTVDVPCYINVLTTTCPNPCNTALPGCEHLCQGTCGSCRNGRLHIRCEEKCKKVLICGHECESNCSNSCPPCQKLCQTACAHSQCGKKSLQKRSRRNRRKNGSKGNDKDPTSGRVCGDPCPPCAEKCLNKCWHRSCSKKCSDPCNVEPCNERCQKLLRCNPKRKSKNKKNAKANGTEGKVNKHFKT
uniref:NFX1-type zinc finger-containing protein 1 n=1 Tax=Panagrolaimus superbus TaxID=310955 RepID=A0A914YH81_9BILA